MPVFQVRNAAGEILLDNRKQPATVIAPDADAAKDHAAYLETTRQGRFVRPESFTAEQIKE